MITKNIKETGTMSPQIAAKDKTVELRGEGLNSSILPGTISNTQGLPPDRVLPCFCAAHTAKTAVGRTHCIGGYHPLFTFPPPGLIPPVLYSHLLENHTHLLEDHTHLLVGNTYLKRWMYITLENIP